MPFEALGEAARFGGRKGLVERRRLVGVEIVLDEDDLLGIGEVDVGDLLQDMGVVDGGAPLADLDPPPAFERGEDHEQGGGSVALVLVVVAGWTSRRRDDRRARFDRQLLGRLVEANDGSFWVVRTPVDVEHVLHAGDEVGVGVGRNDPLFLEVRLEDVFFRIRPMVLSLALATIPSSTTFSSSRRSVQCARPSGGFEQATAISFASASPSKIFGRAHAGLYCRVSTASNPCSTRRLRARETLLRLVSSASTICRSVHAGPSLDSSAFKRILARVATSTIGRPLCRNSSSRVRSSALSRTTYFFPPPRFLPATNHLHRQIFAMEVIHETDSDATTRSTSDDTVMTKSGAHTSEGAVGKGAVGELVLEAGRRRVDNLGCPYCTSHEFVSWGRANALQRFRCKNCGRTFNALTNTPLAR